MKGLNYKDICKVYSKAEIKESVDKLKKSIDDIIVVGEEYFIKRFDESSNINRQVRKMGEIEDIEKEEKPSERMFRSADIKKIESIYAVWLKALVHCK